MNTLTKITKRGLGAAALALSLVTAACEGGPTAPGLDGGWAANMGAPELVSDTRTTAPVTGTVEITDSTASTDTLRLVPRKWSIDEDITKSAWVGPEGGLVEIDATGFRLEIPAGALVAFTEITVTAKAGSFELYEFGPHGIQFEVPVKMTFSVESVETAVALVEAAQGVYLDQTDNVDVLETFPLEQLGFRVLFDATHFSRYALSFMAGYALAW